MVSTKSLIVAVAVTAGINATSNGPALIDEKKASAASAFCGLYATPSPSVDLPPFAEPYSQALSAISAAFSAASASASTITVLATVTATATTTTTLTTSALYPFATDTDFPGLLPLPDDVDPYLAYQKIMASQDNTTVTWWYEGLSTIIPNGLPEVPGLKSQTLMAYRIQHLNDSTMRVDWTELILLGDFNSGEDAHWYWNAESGINATVPNYYYDGPVTYYISRNPGNNKIIDLDIQQPGATIQKATIRGSLYNNQVQFIQYEQKKRTTQTISTLRFIGSLADVRNSSVRTAAASGYYHAFFNGTVSPIFGYPNGTQGDTHIVGNILKEGVTPKLFPVQYAALERGFPEWFSNGVVAPNWTEILGSKGLPI